MRDWRYCPRCATPLGRFDDDGVERPRCPACGLVLYDNPAPCVGAIVERDGAVLLVRRAREPAAGLWDLPGGFVDPGELPLDALRRELREETGLEVEPDPGGLVGFFVDSYGEAGQATLNVFYRARVLGGTPAAASDVAELRWFPLRALPGAGELAFRNTLEALDAYRRTFVNEP